MDEDNLKLDFGDNTPIDPPINEVENEVSATDQAFEIFNEKMEAIGNDDTVTAAPVDLESVEQFIYQDDFDPYSFTPDDPANKERAIANETFGSALGKGLDSFGTRFADTYTEYWKSYGRMADALVHLDWDKLIPDADEMALLNRKEHIDSMKNFVFAEEGTEDDIFTLKTMQSAIGNTGFALGTLAGVTTELVADAIFTVATSGAGGVSFAATATNIAVKLGLKAGVKGTTKAVAKKSTSFIGDLLKGYKEGIGNVKTIKQIAANKMKTQAAEGAKILSTKEVIKDSMRETGEILSYNIRAIFGSKTLGEGALNVAKAIPVVGTGVRYAEKIGVAGAQGFKTAELIGMGLQGARRMGTEFNMASTEASFEAVSSYGQTIDQLIKTKEKKEGRAVTYDEIQEMKITSMNSALANYNTNMAILLATNKLQFGNAFRKFTPSNRAIQEAISVASETGDMLHVNRVWKSSVAGGRTYQKGFMGTYGLLGKISKDFGKKQAVYEVGKQFLKGFQKFSVTEGLQENLQEMSSSAWTGYYTSKHNGLEHSIADSFSKGLSEQFTKKGWNTFVQGAFTGMLIGGPSKALTSISEKANKMVVNKEYKGDDANNPLIQAKKQKEKDITNVNAFLSSIDKDSQGNMRFDFGVQLEAGGEQTEGAVTGDKYKFINGRDNSLIQTAISAERIGATDMIVSQMKNMGVEMTDEEFKSSFGYSVSETKFSSPRELIDNLANVVNNYSKETEKIRASVLNDLEDPYIYEKGSSDRAISSIIRSTQDDAISMIALNKLKASRASERAKESFDNYNSNSGLAESSDYVYRVLASKDGVESEIGSLTAETRELRSSLKEEGLTAAEKKTIETNLKNKESELTDLIQWETLWLKRADVTGDKTHEGHVFAGRKAKKKATLLDDDGNKIKEDDEYIVDRKARELFAKIIKTKNKQAGITADVEASKTVEGFKLVQDFISLDRDAKDYIDAMNAIYSPEKYRAMIKNMREGKFKAQIIETTDMLENIIKSKVGEMFFSAIAKNTGISQETLNKIDDAATLGLRNTEEYKKLLLLVYDAKFDYEHMKLSKELINSLIDKANEILENIANDLGLDYTKIEKEEAPVEEKEKEEVVAEPKEPKPSTVPPKEEEKSTEIIDNEPIIKTFDEFDKTLDGFGLTDEQKNNLIIIVEGVGKDTYNGWVASKAYDEYLESTVPGEDANREIYESNQKSEAAAALAESGILEAEANAVANKETRVKNIKYIADQLGVLPMSADAIAVYDKVFKKLKDETKDFENLDEIDKGYLEDLIAKYKEGPVKNKIEINPSEAAKSMADLLSSVKFDVSNKDDVLTDKFNSVSSILDKKKEKSTDNKATNATFVNALNSINKICN